MQFPKVESLSSPQYTVAVRLARDQSNAGQLQIRQQSARTCGSDSSTSSEVELVKWNEIFFFKIDSPVSTLLLWDILLQKYYSY